MNRSPFRIILCGLTFGLLWWAAVLDFSTAVAQSPAPAPANRTSQGQDAYVRYQRALATQLRRVGESVLPSVVTIETVGVLRSGGEVRQDAPTSGVIVDADGYVLTSSLVTRGESATILVLLADGTRLPAEIVARDTHRELVLLRVDPGDTSLTPIRLDQLSQPSTDWTIGQTVVAVARYGEANRPLVSAGILSALERLGGTAIQTDARVSPAFYGGPLVNLRGECMGILIPAVGQGGGDDSTAWYDSGIAFAIPSDVLAKKLKTLQAGEDVRGGVAGMVVAGRDPYAAGTELSAVMPRSPAEKAGLQAGDEIVRVAGREVRRQQEVKLALGRFDAGDEVTVGYRRNGEEASVSLTLVETIPPLTPQWLGITAQPIDAEQTADDTALEDDRADEPTDESTEEAAQVLVTGLVEGGPAEGTLRIGDRLLSMNGLSIENVDELRQRLWTAESDQTMRLRVSRPKQRTAAEDTAAQDTAPKDTGRDNTSTENSEAETSDASPDASPAGEASGTVEIEVTIDAEPWTGPVSDGLLAIASGGVLQQDDWQLVDLRLTDVPNAAALWMPRRDATDVPTGGRGLLVVVLPPTTRDAAEAMKAWKSASVQTGVAVCLIASEADSRWSGREVDAVSKLTAAAIQQAGIDRDAVAIAGPAAISDAATEKVGPADSMAFAVALLAEQQFSGAALAAETKPPGVQVRRDGPLRLTRVLLQAEGSDGELPSWSEKLIQLGYPIQTLPKTTREAVLRWAASLQAL